MKTTFNETLRVTDEQRSQLREDGFFITDVLFETATLDGVRCEFQRLWDEEIRAAEASNNPRDAEFARRRAFLTLLEQRSTICAAFYRHPQLLSLAEQLVGPDLDMTWDQGIAKPPSAGLAFAWHQDAHYALSSGYVDEAARERVLDSQYGITVWVAITRTTVENGTLWVVPGMHRNGVLPHVYDEDLREWQCQFDSSAGVPAVLEPGQALVFTSLVPHSSGPNVSDEVRMAYQIGYGVPGTVDNGHEVPVLREGELVPCLST